MQRWSLDGRMRNTPTNCTALRAHTQWALSAMALLAQALKASTRDTLAGHRLMRRSRPSRVGFGTLPSWPSLTPLLGPPALRGPPGAILDGAKAGVARSLAATGRPRSSERGRAERSRDRPMIPLWPSLPVAPSLAQIRALRGAASLATPLRTSGPMFPHPPDRPLIELP